VSVSATIEVVTTVEEKVTLTMTPEHASALAALLIHVAGGPGSRRELADEVLDAIHDAGVGDDGDDVVCDEDGLRFLIEGER